MMPVRQYWVDSVSILFSSRRTEALSSPYSRRMGCIRPALALPDDEEVAEVPRRVALLVVGFVPANNVSVGVAAATVGELLPLLLQPPEARTAAAARIPPALRLIGRRLLMVGWLWSTLCEQNMLTSHVCRCHSTNALNSQRLAPSPTNNAHQQQSVVSAKN